MGIPDGETGIRYQIRCRVVAPDGTFRADGAELILHETASTMLLIAIHSNFIDYRTMPGSRGDSPETRCRRTLDNAARFSYEELKQRHLADYRPLFAKSFLALPSRPATSCRRTGGSGSAAKNSPRHWPPCSTTTAAIC